MQNLSAGRTNPRPVCGKRFDAGGGGSWKGTIRSAWSCPEEIAKSAAQRLNVQLKKAGFH